MINIALVCNPFAGLGGAIAAKGSDTLALEEYIEQASCLNTNRAATRLSRFLSSLDTNHLCFYAAPGLLGADYLTRAGIECKSLDYPVTLPTSADDTKTCVSLLLQGDRIDLLLFVGGDGTARDVYDVVDDDCLVLGIPSGVKMHSSVFASAPEQAAAIVNIMASGHWLSARCGEVRDIDEALLKQGRVNSRYYGELNIPDLPQYTQHLKMAGVEDESLIIADVCAFCRELIEADELILMGPGTTIAALAEEIGCNNTLLGFDVVLNGQTIQTDINEAQIYALCQEYGNRVRLMMTFTGHQGFLFGRGNQQLSSRVLTAIGVNNIYILATKAKLNVLNQRPLLIDCNDPEFEQSISGLWPIIVGYNDIVYYAIKSASE